MCMLPCVLLALHLSSCYSNVEASCYTNGRIECCTECTRAPGKNDNTRWKPQNETHPLQSVELEGNILKVFPTGYYMNEVYCYYVKTYRKTENNEIVTTPHTICPNHERFLIKDVSGLFRIEVQLRTSATLDSVCIPSCGPCGKSFCDRRIFPALIFSTLTPRNRDKSKGAVKALPAIVTLLISAIAVGVFVFLWRKRTKHRPTLTSSQQEVESPAVTHAVVSTEPSVQELRSVSDQNLATGRDNVTDTQQNSNCSNYATPPFPSTSPSLCPSEPDENISEILKDWDISYIHAHITREDSHEA